MPVLRPTARMPPLTDATADAAPDASTPCDEPDLIARYTFDGNANDCTSHALHGTITGTARFEPGHTNEAITLDGATFVSLGNTLPTKIIGAFTIATWVKSATLPTTTSSYVVGKTSNIASSGWRLGIDPTNNTSMLVARGSNTEPFSASCNCAQVGKWFHFAGVFQPNGFVRLYIDGKLTAESLVAPPPVLVDSPAELRIGTRGDGLVGTYFNGSIDDMRIYGRALGDAEMANIASQ